MGVLRQDLHQRLEHGGPVLPAGAAGSAAMALMSCRQNGSLSLPNALSVTAARPNGRAHHQKIVRVPTWRKSGSDGARAPVHETVWSRRYAANEARLDSGDLAEIAGVMRGVVGHRIRARLSVAEKRMLARPRRMLGQGR
jgi:hypothetical protein